MFTLISKTVADVFSKKKRSEVMSAIRSSRNESTELAFVKCLRAWRVTGWRRKSPLHGKPDFVFRRERVVVFIDGCFWHGCPQHGRKPDSNKRYWGPKIDRNKTRDKSVSRKLRREGWHVLRIWEHSLKHPETIRRRLLRMLAQTESISRKDS